MRRRHRCDIGTRSVSPARAGRARARLRRGGFRLRARRHALPAAGRLDGARPAAARRRAGVASAFGDRERRMPHRRRPRAVGGARLSRAAAEWSGARRARRLRSVSRARPRARRRRALRLDRGRPPRRARACRDRNAPAPRPRRSRADCGARMTVPVRVLIAEDETIIRLDLRSLLEARGFEVCGEARNGAEAVELAATTNPDVVLLDVKMPVLDGLEAARRITEERSLPVVLITAYGDTEIADQATEIGVFAFLTKPFREDEVVPAIMTAQARHSELTELRREAVGLREALEARKAIERAKGILMAKEGLTEAEAFDRLRLASQRSGRPMKVIAEALAATLS